jgi:hypothetical protein
VTDGVARAVSLTVCATTIRIDRYCAAASAGLQLFIPGHYSASWIAVEYAHAMKGERSPSLPRRCMAVIKKKTRKKLSKQLNKLVKRHGPETTLAFVTGIVSAATTETNPKPRSRAKAAAKSAPKTAAVRKRAAV